MSLRPLLGTLLLALFTLLSLETGLAGSARALTIDCASAGCIGGIYTLDVIETAPDLYIATYTVDTSVPFSVGATSLVDVNFKVANDYSDITVLSGPAGSVLAGPLTANGCSGNNGSFLCVDLSPNLAVGSVQTWQIQFRSSALLDEWHVGARYTSPTHRRGWIISESGSVNPIPEPSAALVFGSGLAVVGGWLERTRKRA